MVGFSGSPGPVMRQKSKGTRPLRNKMRALARRHGYAGFPIAPRPFTAAEVDAYLSGDSITCLLCGRGFRRLANHLTAIHQVTVDDYRAMYGLPWHTGVACAETRLAYAEATKRNIEEGKMPHLGQGVPKGRTRTTKPRQAFHTEKLKANGLLGGTDPHYGRTEFFQLVDRLLTGAKFREIADLPSETWFHKWAREHPEDGKEFRRRIDALPFASQAALSFGIGDRFTAAVRELRADGLSDKKIAARLGVSAMTVFHRRRRDGVS